MTKQTSDKQSLSKDQAELLFAQFALIASSHGWSSESIDKIARLQDYCLATFQPSLAAQDDWKAAALRLGEELWNVGPNGYYEFTPVQWLAWCESNLPTPPPPIEPKRFADGMTQADDNRFNEAWGPNGRAPLSSTGTNVRVEDMLGDPVEVPICDAHAGSWFTERNHLKGGMDATCIVCAHEAPQSATPAHLTAVEFGYRCAEKGMNLQAALSASTDENSAGA